MIREISSRATTAWGVSNIPFIIQKTLRQLLTYSLGRGYWPTVKKDGIRLYRIHLFKWEQIKAASFSSVIFLPHLKVKISGRFISVWFPMYFWGAEEFAMSVLALAPSDSPLRDAVTEENSRHWKTLSVPGLLMLSVLLVTLLLCIGSLLISLATVIRYFNPE